MVKKNTKRALLMSVLSLLLCCSMLIGTTFAWFTDTVESGINKITAGNLDVEVYYGKEAKPETDKVTKDTKNLFTDPEGKEVLWEPGVVAYTNLNVVNEGSLALKYQFAINFDKETENFILGTGARLSEVLKVAFLENPVSGTREEILAAAKGHGVSLENLLKSGSLEAKANKVYGVVVYWEPSDADNNWNVQNGAQTSDGQALHIDLGIKLVATQLNAEAEKDSFDQNYDENAWHPDMIVYNAADLQAALITGGNVSVEADVALTAPLAANTDATINLNGHTLSAVGEALSVSDGANVKIVNGTIEANAADANAITVTNTKEGTTTTLNLIGVQVDLADVGDANKNNIVVDAEAGKAVLNIEDGAVINAAGEWVAAIKAVKNAEVNVNGGVINVENTSGQQGVFGISIEAPGAVVNVTGGVFNITGNHSASGIVTWGDAAVVNISGGTFNVETSGGFGIAVEVYDGEVNATGGTFNIKSTAGAGAYAFALSSGLDLNVGSGVTINVWNKLYSKNDAYDGTDVNPAGCTATINMVEGVSDATRLQEAIDNAQDGDVIQMDADITGNVTITRKAGVNVVLDGNGHKFTGMVTVIGNTDTGSLTIQNVNFVATAGAESAIFAPGKYYVNGVSQNNYVKHVTVDNCTFTEPADDEVDCAAIRAASGGKKYWTVKNCTVDSTMHSFMQVDNIEESLVIENCKVYSKNGANLNSCCNVTITECVFDVKGYAVRFGVKTGGNLGTAKNHVIENSTLKSACDDGDGVIMFRASAVDAVLNLINTKLEGTTLFKGNTDATTITIDGAEYAFSAAQLQAALNAGKKEIGIMGNITLTQSLAATDVTFVGVGENAGINFNGYNIGGSNTITYKNLKLTTVSLPYAPENGERYGWYGGIDYLGHSVANYENCTISGVFTTYSPVINATKCTFDYYVQDGEEFYNIFMYAACKLTATECTFVYGDRAIKAYSESFKQYELILDGCKFVADEGYSLNKALINVSSGNLKLTVKNNYVDEALNTLDLYKTEGGATVTVN